MIWWFQVQRVKGCAIFKLRFMGGQGYRVLGHQVVQGC